MANQRKKPADAGMVSRLAGRGEEAITRLMEELGRNSVVTDALARAMSAKGKIDDTTRGALAQVGLAAADEIKDLRGQLERLEKRLARLEGGGSPTATRKSTAKRSETKKKPTAAKGTKRASSQAKKTEDQTASPAPGRALGGGTARGGTASRGTPG